MDHNNLYVSQMGARFRPSSSFSRNALWELSAEWVSILITFQQFVILNFFVLLMN